MPEPIMSGPHIKFHFEGLLALNVARGEHRFDAGIVRSRVSAHGKPGKIPEHHYSVIVKTIGATTEDISIIEQDGHAPKIITLEIAPDPEAQNPGPGIQLFHAEYGEDEQFNFDWVIDVDAMLQTDAGSQEKAEIKKKALRTVLRTRGINEAIFYTGRRATDPVHIEIKEDGTSYTEPVNGPSETIVGLVALPRTATITWTGHSTPIRLEPREGITYQVDFKNDCNLGGGSHCRERVSVHYNNLFEAKGRRKLRFIDPEDFKSRLYRRASPLTICSVSEFSLNREIPEPDDD